MAMFSEPCLGPTDTEVELLSWMFLPSMERSQVFLSIHVRLGDVLARRAGRGLVTMGRALNLFPISAPASHTHKLFTSSQRSHELLISNLVSPSNLFTYSIAILVQSLGHRGCLWPLSHWLPSLPLPRARCHSLAEPFSLALWGTWEEFA